MTEACMKDLDDDDDSADLEDDEDLLVFLSLHVAVLEVSTAVRCAASVCVCVNRVCVLCVVG